MLVRRTLRCWHKSVSPSIAMQRSPASAAPARSTNGSMRKATIIGTDEYHTGAARGRAAAVVLDGGRGGAVPGAGLGRPAAALAHARDGAFLGALPGAATQPGAPRRGHRRIGLSAPHRPAGLAARRAHRGGGARRGGLFQWLCLA